jgi:preprotein translocase subunit SecA
MGAEEGEVITHALITRSIGNAQKRVEMQNFEARKRLLDYDDVMNQQREVIYDLRTFALEGGEDLKGEAWDMIEKTLDRLVDEHAPEGDAPEEWDLPSCGNRLLLDFFLTPTGCRRRRAARRLRGRDELREYLSSWRASKFHAQLEQFGEHTESLLRFVVLSTIDERWKDHLYDLDHLKASIGFRGWGQKDPLIEYKKEAYDMFVDLMTDIQSSVARCSSGRGWRPPRRRRPRRRSSARPGRPSPRAWSRGPAQRPPSGPTRRAGPGREPDAAVRPPPQPRSRCRRTAARRGRRSPSPRGDRWGGTIRARVRSGKKYKKCHGKQ